MTTGTLQMHAFEVEGQQQYDGGPFPLALACQPAATLDGATAWVADNRHHLCDRGDRLRAECPGFARNCESKGLKYSNIMPSQNDPTSGMGRSWQSTLRATTPEQAEVRLKALGYSWTWLDDGCLRATTPVLPAVRPVSDNRTSFFNQLIAAFQGWKDERNDPSKAITFGDGTLLDRQAVGVATRLSFRTSAIVISFGLMPYCAVWFSAP